MNEKTRTIVFNISALLLLAGAGLYLALPAAAPYLFAVGSAGQGHGFSQTQVAPLQHIGRIAVRIRLRPDVRRTERMGDLPDHFSLASVIHGVCRSQRGWQGSQTSIIKELLSPCRVGQLASEAVPARQEEVVIADGVRDYDFFKC